MTAWARPVLPVLLAALLAGCGSPSKAVAPVVPSTPPTTSTTTMSTSTTDPPTTTTTAATTTTPPAPRGASVHAPRTAAPRPRATTTRPAARSYYASCAAARAAGAAPLHRGEPGYRAGLDRDHDGTACE